MTVRLLWLVLVLLSQAVSAHDLGVARITLHEHQPGTYSVTAKLPENFDAATPVFPSGCDVSSRQTRPLPSKNRSDSWQVTCNQPLALSDRLEFPWQREGVTVRAVWLESEESSGFYPASGASILVPVDKLRAFARPGDQVASHYLTLGVEHILFGWDHLAFVLALCLIASGWQLVKLVTAFTLGHSLTLALATVGWAQIPIPPVEVCIALSIAFVAREAMRPAPDLRHGMGLVFAFGLLHGLGFASALSESGIQVGELLLGLLSFNLGVEIGQLLFVLAVVLIGRVWQQTRFTSRITHATAFGLGTLGMFWTFERIAGFAI